MLRTPTQAKGTSDQASLTPVLRSREAMSTTHYWRSKFFYTPLDMKKKKKSLELIFWDPLLSK